jgi:fatty acid desaturase
MPDRDGTPAPAFSAVELRPLLADLFTRNPGIYWADLLLTALGAYLSFTLVRLLPLLLPDRPALTWPLRGLAFAASCVLFYRGAMFIHELVHLKRGTFLVFRGAWNLLIGIPLLMPSFSYIPHLEHHRRSRYGTAGDGEYLPLAHAPPWNILLYLARPFIVPFLVAARFALFTPAAWLSPAFGRWVYRRASSIMMNPGYLRPPPARGTLPYLRLQETLSFLYCWGLIVLPLLVLHRLPLPHLLHSYLTAVCVLYLSGFRTLGQHRWDSTGQELTLEEQLLDSVNYPHRPFFTELWGPVGLRFHALHHVYPTLPYHALPEAHRRLMQHLPADSPYRRTVEVALLGALWGLWRRARRSTVRPAAGP